MDLIPHAAVQVVRDDTFCKNVHFFLKTNKSIFFLKTNKSVELHEKQSFLVNSLFVLVEELACRKKCQIEGAQKRASSWANVATIFCEKTQYCQITQ